MAALAQPLALAQVLVLMMSALHARGDFLSNIKLPDPPKFNPGKLNPGKLDMAKLSDLAKVDLPPAITNPVEVVRVAQDKIANESLAELAEEGLHKGEAVKAKAETEAVDAHHAAAGLLKKGAGAVSRAKLEDVSSVVTDVVGDKVVRDVKHVVEGTQSGAVATALRGASSHLAETVNHTSIFASEFLRSFGPKASALLTHSGDALACKFSGDCNPNRGVGVHDDVLPFDPEDPESWAFYGFVLFLLTAVCFISVGFLRCTISAGRKGSILLSEAMVPLTGASAREPTIQMRASAEDGLLG